MLLDRLIILRVCSASSFGIFLFCSGSQALAAQEPVLRVLINEGKQVRLRSDGDIPLLITGVGPGIKRVSSLRLRKKNGQLRFTIEGSNRKWSYLSPNSKVRVRSNDPRGIWLGKRRYGGELRVDLRGSRLRVINHLGVERYLASVVGSEMPKSWPIEALKAQAVAARTYALQQLGNQKAFDVKSTELSQVYLGIESETKSTKKAVNSTRSLVLTHKGKLINAVFHSSSGGQTEASGKVWKKNLPYLESVPDYDQHSPWYEWEREFSYQELKEFFPDIGEFKKIQILKTSPTGRIMEAKLSGAQKDLLISGKELRRRLGLKSTLMKFKIIHNYNDPDQDYTNYSPFSLKAKKQKSFLNEENRYLLSNPSSSQIKNILKPVPPLPPLPLSKDKMIISLPSPPPLPSMPGQFILLVRGFGAGHGVGLSQWGAHGMAKKGANYRQILRHYYRGVNITQFVSS